ncbi:hypothetical protein GF327_03475 [Candidatus Woesearchaeota archaeon]|nr:hypothetical protein [Candidatus Woesearchaeota archaeon]
MEKNQIQQKISEGHIHFIAILEILGKPAEHVTKTLNDYLKKIEDKSSLAILKKDIAEPKKQKDSEFFSVFAELEILAKNTKELVGFCFDYMPSSVEIIEPEKVVYSREDFTDFINDLQARLHTVNMSMQDFKQRNSNLIKNTSTLIRNFVTVLLKDPMTIDEIRKRVGITEMELKRLLGILEKEGLVVKKQDKYVLKNG